jgi:hypothetical protein
MENKTKSLYEEIGGEEMEYTAFAAACDDWDDWDDCDDWDDWDDWTTEELPWTDEDEAGLEEYEENKRLKISEQNEY